MIVSTFSGRGTYHQRERDERHHPGQLQLREVEHREREPFMIAHPVDKTDTRQRWAQQGEQVQFQKRDETMARHGKGCPQEWHGGLNTISPVPS